MAGRGCGGRTGRLAEPPRGGRRRRGSRRSGAGAAAPSAAGIVYPRGLAGRDVEDPRCRRRRTQAPGRPLALRLPRRSRSHSNARGVTGGGSREGPRVARALPPPGCGQVYPARLLGCSPGAERLGDWPEVAQPSGGGLAGRHSRERQEGGGPLAGVRDLLRQATRTSLFAHSGLGVPRTRQIVLMPPSFFLSFKIKKQNTSRAKGSFFLSLLLAVEAAWPDSLLSTRPSSQNSRLEAPLCTEILSASCQASARSLPSWRP